MSATRLAVCDKCGKEFRAKCSPSRTGRGRYCGIACRNAARVVAERRECKVCSAGFLVTPSALRRSSSLFCSPTCYKAWCASPQRIAERFWRKVDKEGPVPAHCPKLGPCWVWRGASLQAGYGRMALPGRVVSAHHVALFIETGLWPKRLVIHRCDNPRCARASHLLEGTHAENSADMMAKGRHDPVRGSRSKKSKLTEHMVRAIRAAANDGELHAEIANRFGVRPCTISQIAGRKRWGWLT